MTMDASGGDRSEGAPPGGPEPVAPGSELREVFTALPVLARVAWFSLGAMVAVAITLLAMLRPWVRPAHDERAVPYEGFPFADNAGVCQEYVALATLRTSHQDARAIIQRIAPALPPSIHPDNMRIVRAFAPGDLWTIAVDAQPGAGDMAGAGAVAADLNGIPGTGVRFEPVFYGARRLYDTAQVLCMPRQSSTSPH